MTSGYMCENPFITFITSRYNDLKSPALRRKQTMLTLEHDTTDLF